VFDELNIPLEDPEQVEVMKKKEQHKVIMGNSIEEFKAHLLS
jgi:hypothetical protein